MTPEHFFCTRILFMTHDCTHLPFSRRSPGAHLIGAHIKKRLGCPPGQGGSILGTHLPLTHVDSLAHLTLAQRLTVGAAGVALGAAGVALGAAGVALGAAGVGLIGQQNLLPFVRACPAGQGGSVLGTHLPLTHVDSLAHLTLAQRLTVGAAGVALGAAGVALGATAAGADSSGEDAGAT